MRLFTSNVVFPKTKSLLAIAAIALASLAFPMGCWSQQEEASGGQPIFNVPNSADSKIGSAPKRIKLQPTNPLLSYGRGSLEIQASLKPFTSKFANSTVVIETEYGRKSLGTVISHQGFIVAKYSELAGNKFFCHLGEEKVEGRSLAYHRYHDLVLIEVDARKLGDAKPISFAQKELPGIGHMVISVDSENSSPAIGVVSVPPQRFNVEQPTLEDGIDLGLIVSPFVVTRRVPVAGGARILKGLEVQRVYPRSVAERTGFYVGDLLQTVNGVGLSSQLELKKFARSLRVGQTVAVEVIRDGVTKQLSSRIESFAPRLLHDRWGGGPFSDRRFGFDKVISHDSVIEPEQCGGPLIDLHGNVIGINIARSMRVASFAIPLSEVENFVKAVKPDIELVRD